MLVGVRNQMLPGDKLFRNESCCSHYILTFHLILKRSSNGKTFQICLLQEILTDLTFTLFFISTLKTI